MRYRRGVWFVLFIFTSLISFAQINTPCAPTLFYKTYYHNNFETLGTNAITTKDGGVVICGEARVNLSDGFIMKTDGNGVVQWQRGIGGSASQIINRVIETNDNNLLAFGFDNNNAQPTQFLIKLDMAGNILWRKDYYFNALYGFGRSTLRQDANGDIYVVSYLLENMLSFNDRIILLRLDQAGNILMNKMYRPPAEVSSLFGADFLIKGNSLYITGYYYPQSIVQGLLLKVDKFNGNIHFTKTYNFNGKEANFFRIFPYEQDLYLIGSDNLNETPTTIFVRTDTLGNVVATNYMTHASQQKPSSIIPDKEGGFILASFYRAGWPIHLAITRVHPVAGVKWSKYYPQDPGMPYTEGMNWLQDGSFFISGYRNSRTFLSKFSRDGDNGCPSQILSTRHGAGFSKPTNQSFLGPSLVFTPFVKSTLDTAPLVPEADSSCVVQIFCDSLKLSAPPPVCSKNDTVFIDVIKNPECILTPSLSFDTTQLRLLSFADGVIKMKPLKNGKSLLKVTLSTTCSTLQDSVLITTFFSPDSLSLGADTSLCGSNRLQLNARSGYSSYRWQDGSTDSLFTVTQPGLYRVSVTNSCGAVFTDSVRVTTSLPILFQALEDRVKCNNDTIHLDAPPGFLNYTWSNQYNISSTTAQSVVVNPLVDTAYFLKAEKTPGCFAYDTIRITVHRSPVIDLGPDKNFCIGDSLVLNAGNGFANYLWSNGSTTQQAIAKNTGEYSVIATTAANCKSLDTVRVMNVFPKPSLQLDKNTGLCAGSQRILDPGNFSSYLWNNGSAGRSISVSAIGKYIVTVTDANGCKGTDSTYITTIHPLPSGFLPADTAICLYSSLLLKTRVSFDNYLWNTGAKASSISVAQPGVYWLEVKDNNTCTGRDSVLVNPKQCLEGFYVPTAFTPNGDGKNDLFQPLLFGKVAKYNLIIYNRWGQIVFQTSEPMKSWDGKFTGISQPIGVFVWTCMYQFEGSNQKSEKGTVTLIR